MTSFKGAGGIGLSEYFVDIIVGNQEENPLWTTIAQNTTLWGRC